MTRLIGDVSATGRTAVFYTLIANCYREEVYGLEYLTSLFTRLPTATTRTVRELTLKT